MLPVFAEGTPDEVLVSRWADGDQVAASALFQRYERPLRAFFRRRATEYADDLVQQTMLATLEGYLRLEGNIVFRAYLFGAARIHFIGHLRQQKRMREALQLAQWEAEQQQESDGAASNDDVGGHLIAALGELTAEFKEVVVLTFWEQLTGPEISSALGVPLATVYSRLRRGKAQLAATYGRQRASNERSVQLSGREGAVLRPRGHQNHHGAK
jgi:RNA polymerase sigma-70 factor (ECF subfamily)